ncbi:MAG: TIGR03773 family transporter-associated surface protein [Arcanobacterium sp.]|nr:TIGR03773 family transporter-associated surface protein [Arcanobacterium sp.]
MQKKIFSLPTALLCILCTAALLLLPTRTTEAVSGRNTYLNQDHTDAFYVTTDTGSPIVQVANGINNNLYDPNDVVFEFDASTWADDHPFTQLTKGGESGYYSANWDAKHYFEPGWSAPNQAQNGMQSVEIHFTKISGPGPVAIFGNNDFATGDHDLISPFLKSGNYYLAPGEVLPVPGHQHGHWFFQYAGTYYISAFARATKLNGEVKDSEPFTVAFEIQKNENDERDPNSPTPAITDTTPNAADNSENETSSEDENSAEVAESPSDSSPSTQEGTEDTQEGTEDKKKINVFGKHVINSGHIDLFFAYSPNNTLTLASRDDTGEKPEIRNPESFILHVTDKALRKFPEHLHKIFGISGYFLGQNGDQQANIPFPGWDTSHLNHDFSGVSFKFLNVTGPGKVFLFQSGTFGGNKSVLNSDSLELKTNEVLYQSSPNHVHGNWIFTHPGVYEMTVQASSYSKSGKPVVSNIAKYTWAIGDTTVYSEDSTGKTTSENENKASDSPTGKAGKTQPIPGKSSVPKPTTVNNNLQNPKVTAPQKQLKEAPLNANQCKPKPNTQNPALALIPVIKDDRTAPARWHKADAAPFILGNSSKTKTNQPVGAIPENTTVWTISANQIAGVPWLGANSQTPSFLENSNGALSITLTSFHGPGKMEVFTSGNFGEAVGTHWFSGTGNSGSGKVSLPRNTHSHPNWVFTKPGTYKLGLSFTTTAKSGENLTGSTTLSFIIGNGTGLTNGHFDLGAIINSSSEKVIWQDSNGNPCHPSVNDVLGTSSPTTALNLETPENLGTTTDSETSLVSEELEEDAVKEDLTAIELDSTSEARLAVDNDGIKTAESFFQSLSKNNLISFVIILLLAINAMLLTIRVFQNRK